MNKIKKRLSKLSKNTTSALVIGTAFGQLAQLLDLYSTIFVVNESGTELKAKNDELKNNIQSLKSNLDKNINLIKEKNQSPEKSLEILSTEELIVRINDRIGAENKKIREFNQKLKDRVNSKAQIKKELWMFVINHMFRLLKKC